MATEIKLHKELYVKDQFDKVINTNFNQLVNVTSSVTQSVFETETQVVEFFNSYNELFFSIPKFGEYNSHEYLIKTSTEYIGTVTLDDNTQALIEEINSLKQSNLDLQQQLVTLQNTVINSITGSLNG
jgi:hypothetical protein